MSTDILISLDSTGSMSPILSEARRKVSATVRRLFKTIDNLRIAIIVHGDYCDEPRAFFHLDFTTDVHALVDFVRTAPNTSGGDGDEFYEYVFERVQDFDWQADNRKMIFIADAEPHEVGYKYGAVTYYLDWKEEVKKIAAMGINIYSVEALGDRNSRSFYEPVAYMTNGKKVSLNQFTDAVETIIAISYHNS